MLPKLTNSPNLISYPYAVFSDCHLHSWSAFSHINKNGINNRLQHILDGIELVAATLEKSGGKDIVFCGDMTHTRGSTKPSVINPAFDLFSNLSKRGFNVHALVGNHDSEFTGVSRLGTAFTTFGSIPNFHVYCEPTLLASGHLFIPWDENSQRVLRLANKTAKENSGLTLFAHVGLNGVIPASMSNTLNPTDFDERLERGFFGHFHNYTSFDARVFSVGALTHQTWSDVRSKAGFLIVHENQVEHFETKAPKFVDYNRISRHVCSGNYVRIKDIELTSKEAAFLVEGMKARGALGVIDQSTRPSIIEKRHEHAVSVDLGIDSALESYCKHTFGDNWKRVYEECLKLKS